ncbi:MAG: RnfABCDGE type electron transport complex subunit D [Defluviitaleaceae bacterium]|nr:RnfABCDGE type electron transport complex subunit D [Defluviitaleaceae bacterium]
MNFPLKSAPHVRGKRTNADILSVVIKAALFVAVWAIYNRFAIFGIEVGVHIVLMIITACTAGTFAHYIFDVAIAAIEKRKFDKTPFVKRFKNGETIITGLILALAMQPTVHLYVVAIVAIFAEIFGKLIYGGYGQNIFNPVAVGLIFNALAFGGTALAMPYLADVVTGPTPLVGLNAVNWTMNPMEASNFLSSVGGAGRMLLGLVPGAIAETSRLALILALIYMCYKRVADWVTPVVYIGTIFIITTIYGFIIGAGFWYPLIHLLTGGIIFGATFLATDPVTIPITRQGKVMFGILLAMFTLLIRFNSSHGEAVAFSILLMNIVVGIIDVKSYGITSDNIKKKKISLGITFVAASIIVIGFTLIMS